MRDCTIYVAKTKTLISCAVTAKLICVLVFAYAKNRFSIDAANVVCCIETGRFLFKGRSGAVDRASDFGPRGPWFDSPPVHISLWP